MTEIPDGEFAAHPGEILDRVRSGEAITVTEHGAPVAAIRPVDRTPGLSWDEFWTRLEAIPPDPSFAADVHDLTADAAADEVRWR